MLRDIVARGQLTLQEIQVATWVWVHSWGYNQQHTVRPPTAAELATWCGKSSRVMWRVFRQMLATNVLVVVDDVGNVKFNEHVNTWVNRESKPAKQQNNQPELPLAIGTELVPNQHQIGAEKSGRNPEAVGTESVPELAPNWCQPIIIQKTEKVKEHGVCLSKNDRHTPRPEAAASVTKPKQKTDTQRVNDADVEAVRLSWVRRFPSAPELEFSMAQKVIGVAMANGCDPDVVLEQVNTKAATPVAYLATVMRKRVLDLPDGTKRHRSWHAWANRNRGRGIPGMTGIGDVLAQITKNALQGRHGTINDPTAPTHQPTTESGVA